MDETMMVLVGPPQEHKITEKLLQPRLSCVLTSVGDRLDVGRKCSCGEVV